VNLILDEFSDFDELFRKGASARELEHLPRHVWGKDEEMGTFRIAMTCLGSYRDNFINGVKLSCIKECKTLVEFITLVKAYNGRNAILAQELRQRRDGWTATKKDVEEFQEKQAERTIKKIQRRYKDEQAQKRVDSPAALHILQSVQKIQKRAGLDSDISDTDDTDSSEGCGRNLDGNFTAGVEDQSDGFAEELEDAELNVVEKKVFEKKTNPCFNKFFTGQCDVKDCKFGHSIKDMEELRIRVGNSPYARGPTPVKKVYRLEGEKKSSKKKERIKSTLSDGESD
jgi:hypothetical protein